MKYRSKLGKQVCAVIVVVLTAALTDGCGRSANQLPDGSDAEIDASILIHDERFKAALRNGYQILTARVREMSDPEAISDKQNHRYRLSIKSSYGHYTAEEYINEKREWNMIASTGKIPIHFAPGTHYLLIVDNARLISGAGVLVEAIPMTNWNVGIGYRLRSRIDELWRQMVQDTSFPDRVLTHYLRMSGTAILDVQVLSRRTLSPGSRSQSESYLIKVNRALHGRAEESPLAIGHYGDPLLEPGRRYVVIVNTRLRRGIAPGFGFCDHLALPATGSEAISEALTKRIHGIVDAMNLQVQPDATAREDRP